MIFVADFETTTDEQDCRVWACGIYCLESGNFSYGNTIDYLFNHFNLHPSSKYFFHNLKFDGEFIFYELLKNRRYNFTAKRKLENKEFTALISDRGVFYSIALKTETGSRVEIYDSLKLLPFPVEDIPSGFGFEMKKGSIDYEAYRERGYKLSPDEVDYLYYDCKIVGEALKQLFNEGLKKSTIASNAMNFFKDTIGKKNFERWFPLLNCDEFCREAYKGAFTYCNPRIAEKDIGEGIVLDVNSLYPYVLHEKMLPYGEPIRFDGEYEEDKQYPIYIAKIRCSFELKEGMLPTIQLKKNLSFCPTEYLTSSDDKIVTMTMTSVDIKLMFEHYNVHDLEWLGGYKFKCSNTIFRTYVDYWTKKKIDAGKAKNKPQRAIAKLMLNGLYGKFGLNPKADRKFPYISDEGIVKYKLMECPPRETVYVPVAAFTTAYAREMTISTAQACYDRFLYSDTDSIHLKGLGIPDNIWVDDYELGAWAHEKTFKRARFIHAKCYIETENDEDFSVTVAGLPKRAHENVTWDNFMRGERFDGKMQMVHVPGGIVLKPIDFRIK